MTVGNSPEWLPPGFTEKVKVKNGRKSKIYIDSSSGMKFFSKRAVERYLNTLDHANTITVENKTDNVEECCVKEPVKEPNVEPSTISSLPLASMSQAGEISNVESVPTVDAALIDTSPQLISVTSTDDKNKMKKKYTSFTTVDDDLPPGWIKEIRISKSGKKERKDPFYTDPVGGYIFRSKKDVMRYLETNDITNCVNKTMKIKSDAIKLLHNKSSSSDPANEILPADKISESNGEEPSGTKGAAESESKHEETTIYENSAKEAKTINSPALDSISNSKQTVNVSPVTSNNSKKRKGLSLPSRTSKRRAGSEPKELSLPSRTSNKHAGSEPERVLIPDVSENSYTAAALDKSPNCTSSECVPDAEPSESVPEAAVFKGDKTHEERLREIVENLFNDVEEPPPEAPQVESGGEKQIDESKKDLQLRYDFGDSWADPLEFAFKTLMGEISIEDSLRFPSVLPEEDGRMKQPQDAPRNETAGSSKPASSSLGDMGFATVGNDVGKKDFQAIFKP